MSVKYLFISSGLLCLSVLAIAQPPAKKKAVKVTERVVDVKFTTKEFMQEVPAARGSTVLIGNSTRNLEIHIWKENKVKFITTGTVTVEKATSITNEQLIEQSGITLRAYPNHVELQSRIMTVHGFKTGGQLSAYSGSVVNGLPEGSPVYGVVEERLMGKQASQDDESGKKAAKVREEKLAAVDGVREEPLAQVNAVKEKKAAVETGLEEVTVVGYRTRESVYADSLSAKVIEMKLDEAGVRAINSSSFHPKMVVYLPEGVKLELDNTATDVYIADDLGDAQIKLSRCNLDAGNFHNIYLVATLSNVNFSDADEAELDLKAGTLTAGTLMSLDLDSKGAEFDYQGGKTLYLRSQDDHISVDEVGSVYGHLQFSSLRLGTLHDSMDLDGVNTDIKIRNIHPTVGLVRIKDQYANLRLPVRKLVNYQVAFNGQSSTTFVPFEKKDNPVTGVSKTELKANNEFTASVGDATAKPTKFEVTCLQCTVDFK